MEVSTISFSSPSPPSLSASPPLPPHQPRGATAADLEAVGLRRLSDNLQRLLDPAFLNCADAEIALAPAKVGAAVPVHRCILAARSAFFLHHFASLPAAAGGGGERPRLELADLVPGGRHIGHDALVHVLGYLYTGRLTSPQREATVCMDDKCDHETCRPAIDFVVESMYAACGFQISELISLFQHRLSDFVSEALDEDVVPIIHVASTCDHQELLNQCIQRVAVSTLDSRYVEKELPDEIYCKIKEIRRSMFHVEASENAILDPEHEKRVRNILKALDSDDVDLVGLLLKESTVTLDDAYAIHYAAAYCEPKVFAELLKLDSANVNRKNISGYTPLHIACMRREPDIILSLVERGASVLERTLDDRDALTICKSLTKERDCNRKLEKYQEKSKAYLCIDILEQELKRKSFIFDPISIEESFATPLLVDNFHMRLINLENRAKLVMRIAQADLTEEFAGITNFSKLKEVALNETPTMQNKRLRERLDALTKTVELGRRYFPHCSDVLDKFLNDESTDLIFLETGTPEDQRVKRMRFSELKEDARKAFKLLSDITKGFSNEQKIGHGSFGEVYKGELPNGAKIAVKKLRQHLMLVDDVQFKTEVFILKNLKHHNIVQFVGYCHETEPEPVEINGKVVIAERQQRALCFEYLQNGCLRTHLSEVSRGLNWQARYKIIKGICEGLNYLHNGSEDGRPIYHMDLKPDNILLDENMVPKIADFGLSRLLSTTQSHTTKTSPGTPGYMPPEYIDIMRISNKFDVYSLGVIIIDIMIGPSSCRLEYDEASSDKEYSNLVQANWNRRLKSTPSHTSQETDDDSLKVKTCIEIALKCIKKDRVERPTVSLIVDTLKYIHTAQRSLLVDQARLVKFGLWGGKGGRRQDIKTAPHRLQSVTIYSLDVINALEFSYTDCNGQHYTAGPWGGAGGIPNKVQLHPSEVLVELQGTVGPTDGIPVITSLMLVTDAGRYGPFGRGDGTLFRICMQNNGHIAGFFGRADKYVNAVGVYTNQEESHVGLCKVGPWGGAGGFTCDIDVPPHYMQSLTVHCSDHIIHSLAFSYSDRNGQHHMAGPWGGIGGEEHKIDLEPYEFLVKLCGTTGEFSEIQTLITSLTLVTNVATYGPFGEVRGTGFDIPVHSNSCIVGFFAHAGTFVNAIGVYARPIQIVMC